MSDVIYFGELISTITKRFDKNDYVNIPILKFNNPIFHNGYNITVRLGYKWYDEPSAFILNPEKNKFTFVSLTAYKFFHFSELENYASSLLINEHDPSCRTYEGLLKCMKETYKDFHEDSPVTVIGFHLDMKNFTQYDSE